MMRLSGVTVIEIPCNWDGPWIGPDGDVYETVEDAELAGLDAEDLAPWEGERDDNLAP